jgi:inorganic pyrophosphatase
MPNLYHQIPSLVKEGNYDHINVLIEIPKDSFVKYEYSNTMGCMKVDRLLKTPLLYNFNYGDIPQAWNTGDNDPLDAIVLSRASFFPGVIVPCRVIGGLRMYDKGEYDYKIIAVADDKYYEQVQNISDVSIKEKEDIEYFMTHYKDLEKKLVTLDGWDGKDDAIKVIKDCVDHYHKHKKPKA